MLMVIAMCLYPPWQYAEPGKPAFSMGYAPIWQPPVVQEQAKAELFGFKLQMGTNTFRANQIDLLRLAIQCFVMVAMTAVLLRVVPTTQSGQSAQSTRSTPPASPAQSAPPSPPAGKTD
jgi:hypothetical protein